MAVKCDGGCYRPKPFRPTTRVTFQRINPNATKNDMAETDLTESASWIDLGTFHAEEKPRGGTERFSSDQIQAGHTFSYRLRRNPVTKSVTPEDRIVVEGNTLGIFAIAREDGRNFFMNLDAIQAK